MQQVIQDINNGEYQVVTLPDAVARPGQVLIANEVSLISAGTEKMLIDLAKKSLIGKARERPDHVRRVLEKVKQEGLLKTVDAVRKRLDKPIYPCYSSAGVVLACGHDVQASSPPPADLPDVDHLVLQAVAPFKPLVLTPLVLTRPDTIEINVFYLFASKAAQRSTSGHCISQHRAQASAKTPHVSAQTRSIAEPRDLSPSQAVGGS